MSRKPTKIVWRLAVAGLLSLALVAPTVAAPTGRNELIVAQGADITTGDPRIGVIGVDYSVPITVCQDLQHILSSAPRNISYGCL